MTFHIPKKVPLTEEEIKEREEILKKAIPLTQEEFDIITYDEPSLSEELALRMHAYAAKKELDSGYKIVY